ncbi:MAG: FAD/NAD(P)-binding protein [Hyphomicrobium sp.]
MPDPGACDIIVIGGGASGALLAIQLLRIAEPRLRVTLIERRAEVGRGLAYGSAQPMHLLNVRGGNMSAHPDAPDHFLDWVDANRIEGVTGTGKFRFVPRLAFGAYLDGELQSLASLPANRNRYRHVRGEAMALDRTVHGIDVTLADGRHVGGDVAVLATGFAPPQSPRLPHALRAYAPIDAAAFANVDNVLILGTGHSAIDHIQSLLAAGYRGHITALSRRGLLPAVHRPIAPASIEAGDIPLGGSLGEVWRWFRDRADAAEREGSDWRAILDGLRPHAHVLWRSLAETDRRRFLRHARAWWDVRRHRMAPSVAASLQELVDSGRLGIIAGHVLAVTPLGEGPGTLEVVYRRRGEGARHTLRVGAIIDCTGFSLDVGTSNDPLVRNLLAHGLARPDPLGLGFEVGSDSQLIQADGSAARDLFAVGPITRGAFWETVGIPDIRGQCARLAAHLARDVIAPGPSQPAHCAPPLPSAPASRAR